MGQGQFYPIRPPSETARVAGHGREIERLQRRNPEPRWMYATPVAPASAPDDYRSGDTLYPAFQSPWGNLDSTHLPFSYRFAYGAIQLRGTITGGEATPNSLIATIPATYPRPTEKEQHLVFMGSDGSSIGLVEANTDGTLVFIGLAAGTGSPFVGLGGKVPWFETLYLTSSGASGAPILANNFGGTSSRIRTTDNPAGYTENSTGPQVYTAGAYFACDYSLSPSTAVQVLQAGVYMIHVERLIAYGEISADVNASIGVMVTMGSGHTAFFADSRVIDDSMLTDANGGLFTMNIGRVDAARAVYIDSPATIQVEYMNEGVVGDSQIWLSIFRVSDGNGNSAPGAGSGIAYDFANTGDWLQVAATGSGAAVSTIRSGSWSGLGIGIVSTNDVVIGTDLSGAGNLHLDSFDVYVKGSNHIYLDAPDGIDLASTNGVLVDADTLEVDLTHGMVIGSGNSGDLELNLGTGRKLKVTDSSNNPIFEVHEDGSVHIKTGTSIIADL